MKKKAEEKPSVGTAFIMGVSRKSSVCNCEMCRLVKSEVSSSGTHGNFSGTGTQAATVLRAAGYEIRLAERDLLYKGKLPRGLTQKTLFKGDTKAVRNVYGRLFPKQIFPNIDIPAPLLPFARRWAKPGTMSDLRAWCRDKKFDGKKHNTLFVKPLLYAKDFSGSLIENESDMSMFGMYPDNYALLFQEKVDIGREHRYLVIDGAIQNKQVQTGYSTHAEADNACAEEVAAAWKADGLGAYTVDIGDINGKPGVVEVNSILTSGRTSNWPDVKYGEALIRAWESYMNYGRTGKFV